MELEELEDKYSAFIKEIKDDILQSKYTAAKLVNREMLVLYYSVGKRLSEKIASEKWGAKVIEKISQDIQQEFLGIKSFSPMNLKNMRRFYDAYNFLCIAKPVNSLKEEDLEKSIITIGQTVSVQIQNFGIEHFLQCFFQIGFSHHLLLLQKCKTIEKRLFYFEKSIENQWSYRTLEYHIESKLYEKQGKIQTNFPKTLPEKLQKKALNVFKDEYLLNHINVQNEEDELAIEQEIVHNIKAFLTSLGDQFCFIGNQHRLIVDEEEFFVDLLFFHRGLQALIAIELKAGKFKPEHVGKLNFYLSALDDLVRLPHENPSIGIILCKKKSKTIVEYAFRDTTKAMGVATYTISSKLPKNLQKYLPDAKILEKHLDNKGSKK
ncbi:MAG: DUF1016 domain-containing protein [Candidatus Brocadiae bacterium]|nr:DUF1016 domain-containing protein [Candidatus Brocadiia bacterium]